MQLFVFCSHHKQPGIKYGIEMKRCSAGFSLRKLRFSPEHLVRYLWCYVTGTGISQEFVFLSHHYHNDAECSPGRHWQYLPARGTTHTHNRLGYAATALITFISTSTVDPCL